MPRTESYSEAEFAGVVAPLRRATDKPVDEQELREDLESILCATGVLTLTGAEQDFAEAVERARFKDLHSRPPNDPDELLKAQPIRASAIAARRAAIYDQIIRAEDVRFYDQIARLEHQDPIVGSELRAGLRTSAQFDPRAFEELADIAMIRAVAERLRTYHLSFVRAGQPQKSLQETLLRSLAAIFLRHIGSDQGADTLPHAISSHFISFSFGALKPFVQETTLSALSSSWRRMKMRESAAE